jgi:hypothetical protein
MKNETANGCESSLAYHRLEGAALVRPCKTLRIYLSAGPANARAKQAAPLQSLGAPPFDKTWRLVFVPGSARAT